MPHFPSLFSVVQKGTLHAARARLIRSVMQRMWPSGFALCALILSGCSSTPKAPAPGITGSKESLEDIQQGIQHEYDEYLQTRTPEKEYQKNLQDGLVCFYCWGSVANGYHYPGLTQEQVDRLVIRGKMNVRVYWRDDPVSLLAGTEPFDSMITFIQSYNQHVLEHLKDRHDRTTQTTPGLRPSVSDL